MTNLSYISIISVLIFLNPPIITASGDPIIEIYGHFAKYKSGVIYDTHTNLEWYPGPDQKTSWEDAHAFAMNLRVAGGGWRMPTKKELKTLYDVGDGIDNITPFLKNSGYWVWAGQAKEVSSVWIFSFSYGGEGWPGRPPLSGGRGFAVRKRQ